jgi:hypothetical protein
VNSGKNFNAAKLMSILVVVQQQNPAIIVQISKENNKTFLKFLICGHLIIASDALTFEIEV